ncbi:MAG: hypothetical protein A2033_17600 [Bacteroidetes bacterium GWA2_31_9]|nr:MAG: hypothetical protein A2033_17600 [Bacteroidetes bacterium GWA2_31_9]
MKIKHDANDIVIDVTNPFVNCKLGRKQYADILTNIVSNYADGFVLAVNNEWGTGKTTFVKMWQQQLINEGFTTMYFNAWENDFEQNPMAALVSELSVLKDKNSAKIFKSVIEKGAVLTKNILPQLVKAIVSKYVDTGVLLDSIENTAKGATEIFEAEVKNYTSKKESFQEFREELTKFIASSEKKKPIIFFIDELDRCRPDYAVHILENVKHFFSVSGIVFVLSIDKVQLSHAIRGFYGSENINADDYLRRFIDIEYNLPAPNTKDFCNYLYDYFQIDSFFNTPIMLKNKYIGNKESFITVSSILFEKSEATLRQQEKIFAHTRLALILFQKHNLIFPDFLIILVYCRVCVPEFYIKLKQKKLSANELLIEFAKIIPINIPNDKIRYFIHIEALLSLMYNNSLPNGIKIIIENNSTDNSNIPFKSCIDRTDDNRDFIRFLQNILNDFNNELYNYNIAFLLEKIDLTESVKI